MNRRHFVNAALCATLSGFLIFTLLPLTARANVETDGGGFGHSSPTQTGNYTSTSPISFTDGTTWTARRVAPLQTPEDVTAYSRNGYAQNSTEHIVNSTSKAHSWTGTDVTDWSDSSNLDGSVSLSAGSYGYWARIYDSINGGSEETWVNALTGNTAQISGGFTVR